ncbi:hypothetical protein ACYSNW_07615 [Enterococcus sp. LJL99]
MESEITDSLNVTVSFQQSKQQCLAKASTTNLLIGTVATCYGLISKRKTYFLMGGFSVLSALILKKESKLSTTE